MYVNKTKQTSGLYGCVLLFEENVTRLLRTETYCSLVTQKTDYDEEKFAATVDMEIKCVLRNYNRTLIGSFYEGSVIGFMSLICHGQSKQLPCLHTVYRTVNPVCVCVCVLSLIHI